MNQVRFIGDHGKYPDCCLDDPTKDGPDFFPDDTICPCWAFDEELRLRGVMIDENGE
jgi:hypothetical protein